MVQDNVIRFIHLCESEHCHDKFLINLATINFLKKTNYVRYQTEVWYK